jgi:hypothetical protein
LLDRRTFLGRSAAVAAGTLLGSAAGSAARLARAQAVAADAPGPAGGASAISVDPAPLF